MTEVVTESKNETGIGTEKILTVGKVQEHHEDTENAPGVGTGTRNGQGHGNRSATETDTANLVSVSLSASVFHFLSLLMSCLNLKCIKSHSYCKI